MFIYDYGSNAIECIKELKKDDEVVNYLKELSNIINNITTADVQDVELVENFFEVIGELLDNDIEDSKYMHPVNNQDIFSSRYLYK